ncbi:MAG TPA: FAD-dependent oxidoreductase [Acidimicrobiales bacterium]|nr:FAD-dependent oxidoreductase [Acidimicrobiales bacterium]
MEVLVIGAGIGGLGTALALAQQGHHVTVVERDATTVPDSPDAAFEQWARRGAPQVRHSHAFLARLRNLLRDRAPEVLAALVDAGATELRYLDHPPPTLADRQPRPGDEDLVALACRRTTFEWVLRRTVLDAHDVRLVEGAVSGLVAHGARSVPQVTGVRLASGAELPADIVVDASGVRSPLPSWLGDVGVAALPEREDDTGIVYSSRFYRLLPGVDQPSDDGLLIGDLGYLKYAVFVGDNRTFSITFAVPSEDRDLRQLLRPAPFSATAAALPATSPWTEPGVAEPITGVEVMARLVNRRRRFVVGDRPLVSGLFAVGDSHICTNPLYGRGCPLAMVQAYLLADTLAADGVEPHAAALAFHAAIEREVAPWYRATVVRDRLERRAPRSPAPDEDDPAPPMDDDSMRSLLRDGILPAAGTDPVVYRAFLRAFNLLDPPDVLTRDPEVVARVLTVWQDRDSRPPPEPLGPGRDELLRRLAEGAAA